jgi:hypothetical protein
MEKIKNHILLWLDDIRDPFKSEWNVKIQTIFGKENDLQIVWLKNYDEFVQWISKNGLPDIIGFDHDLADEHYRPSMYDQDEHYSNYYHDGTFKEKTGYDCAKWLVEYCQNNNLQLPRYFVQSMNPVGKNNIISLLGNGKF